jgi:hypothetical protein
MSTIFETLQGTGGVPSGVPPTLVTIPATVLGNFTVAHGLGASPAAAIQAMTSAGTIYFQHPAFDATNLYLTADAINRTAVIACFMHTT